MHALLLLALAAADIDVRVTDQTGAVVHCTSAQPVRYAVSTRAIVIDCASLFRTDFEG